MRIIYLDLQFCWIFGIFLSSVLVVSGDEAHKDHYFDILFDVVLVQSQKSKLIPNVYKIKVQPIDLNYGPLLHNVNLRDFVMTGFRSVERRGDSLIQSDSLKLHLKVADVLLYVTGTFDIFSKTISRRLMGRIDSMDIDATLSIDANTSQVILKDFQITSIHKFTLSVVGDGLNLLLENFVIDVGISTFKDVLRDGIEKALRSVFDKRIRAAPQISFIVRFSRTFYDFRTSGYYVWIPIPFVTAMNFLIPYLI